jgi:hypothetical protein
MVGNADAKLSLARRFRQLGVSKRCYRLVSLSSSVWSENMHTHFADRRG